MPFLHRKRIQMSDNMASKSPFVAALKRERSTQESMAVDVERVDDNNASADDVLSRVERSQTSSSSTGSTGRNNIIDAQAVSLDEPSPPALKRQKVDARHDIEHSRQNGEHEQHDDYKNASPAGAQDNAAAPEFEFPMPKVVEDAVATLREAEAFLNRGAGTLLQLQS